MLPGKPDSEDRIWHPNELGLKRSFGFALVLEVLAFLTLYLIVHAAYQSVKPASHPHLKIITQAHFVSLPQKAPKVAPKPPPPKPQHHVSHPHPKPLPKPKPQKHVVPKQVHRVIHKPKPVHKPVPKPRPQPVHKAVVVKKKPALRHPQPHAAPPTHHVSPLQIYAGLLHALIQAHVHVGRMIRQLGLSGVVKVAFVLGPKGGRPRQVHVVAGAANPLIKKSALESVRRLSFPPFTKGMPKHPIQFIVPVQISTQ